MKKIKKLIIACDGESASGKSTAAKLISKKYRLLLINSGLLYRYASKLIINHNPKNQIYESKSPKNCYNSPNNGVNISMLSHPVTDTSNVSFFWISV